MLRARRRQLWSAERLGEMPLIGRILLGWSCAGLASRAQLRHISAEAAAGGLTETTPGLTSTLFALRRVHIIGGDVFAAGLDMREATYIRRTVRKPQP